MRLNFKKILAAAAAALMLVSFTGCNREGDSSSDSSNIEENVLPARKVGYIFQGDAGSFGFTSQFCEQRLKAANRCSMETCYVDHVTVLDFENAVKKLSEAGCTDIVSCNAAFSNVLLSTASKYMNLNFIGYGTTGGTANVSPYTEHTFQGAYVAGMAAAFNSNARKIGFVGDKNLIYVTPAVNAAALGMQIVYAEAELYCAEATGENEVRQAVDELYSRGCDVIICYTATDVAEKYCQQRGVKFISNLDMSGREDEFSNMLMYFYCKRDSYFLAQFKLMQSDKWLADSYVGTFGNGIVNVSPALNAKEGTQKIMDALVPKVASGAAPIFSGQLIDNNGVVRTMQTDIMSDDEVYNMDWYVQGVEYVGSFRKPQTTTGDNPLEIKS